MSWNWVNYGFKQQRTMSKENLAKYIIILMELQDIKHRKYWLANIGNVVDYYSDDIDEHLVSECILVKILLRD